ncbi:hypothetical protein ACRAWD_20420 [Caulobacter segnis]
MLSPDDALPPERDMADEFNVSRITIRQGAGRPGQRGSADAPPGRRDLRRRAGREELLQTDLLHRRHDLARAHAAQRVDQRACEGQP